MNGLQFWAPVAAKDTEKSDPLRYAQWYAF